MAWKARVSTHHLPDEVVALLERVAAHPLGPRLLLKGNLESIAVLFGVHPALLDGVRESLGDPAVRSAVTAELLRARSRRPAAQAGPGEGLEPPLQRPAATPQGLLALAGEVPDGEEFLYRAAQETVAVIFGVHPAVVEQARELLRLRGPLPQAWTRTEA